LRAGGFRFAGCNQMPTIAVLAFKAFDVVLVALIFTVMT
jgi:hypothetical protein